MKMKMESSKTGKGKRSKKINLDKRHSIKAKMIAFLALLILAICGGMGIMSYNIASNAIVKNIDEMLPQIAEESASALENLINGKLESLHITANNIGETSSSVVKELFLADQQEKGEYLLLGTSDMAGNMLASNGMLVNVREYDFFQKAMQGQDVVSEPIVDMFSDTSELVVIYAVPMYRDGEIYNVLIGVRPAEEFFEMFDQIQFGETGNAFMVNEKGDMIAHPNKSLVTQKFNFIEKAKEDSSLGHISEMLDYVLREDSGAGEYRFEGIDKYAGFASLDSTGWSLVVTGDKADVLSGLVPLRIFTILLTIVMLAVGVFSIYIIANSLTNKIDVVVDSLGYMAQGDLTRDIPEKFLKEKDEIGQLSQSIQTTQESFRQMLENIRKGSQDTDVQAENLSAVSEEMTSATENVSITIQEVAKGAGTQAQSLSDMTMAMNDFSKELEAMVHAIQDIDANAHKISSMSTESNEEVEALMDSSKAISKTFNEFIDKINVFNENVKQIDEIAAVINGIADETNLLSLNAAIEAARSGEAGRGFAVVADQIRKLAEETKISSNNINDIVQGIASESESMVSNTEDVNKGLQNQVSILNTTIESFENINNAINDIANEIELVNSSAFQLDGRRNKIVEEIGEVASISQEVSSSSEEIAASSEEMNASMQEIAASAQILKNSTHDTMELVRRFKLKSDK